MPVSMTAMPTPSPVAPSCHAAMASCRAGPSDRRYSAVSNSAAGVGSGSGAGTGVGVEMGPPPSRRRMPTAGSARKARPACAPPSSARVVRYPLHPPARLFPRPAEALHAPAAKLCRASQTPPDPAIADKCRERLEKSTGKYVSSARCGGKKAPQMPSRALPIRGGGDRRSPLPARASTAGPSRRYQRKTAQHDYPFRADRPHRRRLRRSRQRHSG